MSEILFVGQEQQTKEQVLATIRAVVAELAPEAGQGVGSESRLIDDLCFHSLALLELAFTLEDEFDLEPIDEQIAREIITVGDVERHVIGELEKRSQPTG